MIANDLMHRAEGLREGGQLEEALPVYREIIAEEPENGAAKLGLAQVLRERGVLDQALEAYADAIATFSKNGQPYENVIARIGRAEVLSAVGRLEEAQQTYGEALREGTRTEHPAVGVALVGLAKVLRSTGEFEKSLALYSEAIAQHPDDMVARLGRAEIFHQMGRLEEAQSAYLEIIAEQPQNLEAGLGYAQFLHKTNQIDRAEEVYRRLISIHPESPLPKLGLGEMMYATGRLAEAEKVYSETIHEHPDNVNARLHLAETLHEGKQLDEAEQIYREVLTEDPHSDSAKFGIAQILHETNRPGEAAVIYRELVATHPESAELKALLEATLLEMEPSQKSGAPRPDVAPEKKRETATKSKEASKKPTTEVRAPSVPGRTPVGTVVAPGEKLPSTGPGVAEQAKPKTKPSDASLYYQPTYSAFVPDRPPYRLRSSNEPLADELKVGVHAGHLAQLIAAKETSMPLSIGLFGAWGSGKSYFIDLLDENLRALVKKPGKVFYQNIVQIRFNAWHYLDTNLWANLVCEIFDQLFATLGKNKETEKQAEKLKSELARQSALAAEAKEALKKAETVRINAEADLHRAMQERVQEERKVGTMLDDLTNLAINDDVRRQLAAAAEGLGLPKLESSFAELETRVAEMRSLGGRAQALALAVFTGPGWWRRAVLLAAAVALPLGVAWLAKYGTPAIRDLLQGAGKTIAQAVAAITALSAWLSKQAKAGNSLVQKVETAYDEVKRVRDAREAKSDAVQAQQALAAKRQAEEQARHTLHEAEEKMKTIKAELAELAPGRQLIRFLKERASAEDYKRHLGLVSLVRKDFEQLSELLTNAGQDKDPSLPQIDRIVLYIDDLDRCRADRVIEVLEAVHLLLAFPLFAVVVAVDPRWLRQSLLDHYPRLLGGAEDAQAKVRLRTLGRPATPQDYLEKIFQVPFNIQAMEETGFKALVADLFSIRKIEPKEEAESQGNIPPSLTPTASTPAADPPKAAAPSPFFPAGTSPPSPKPPPDPQRLALTKKEITDVQRFQPLFQTPRAVKRLANTYCLIRVGVEEENWAGYLGPGETPGTYRVTMLLLAVTSSFPALARPWLLWLLETAPKQWQLSEDQVAALTDKNADTTDRADWERLAGCLERVSLKDWPAPVPDQLTTWVPRVARYSF